LLDLMSVGVLTKVFPAGVMDAVITQCGRTEQRCQFLPARSMVLSRAEVGFRWVTCLFVSWMVSSTRLFRVVWLLVKSLSRHVAVEVHPTLALDLSQGAAHSLLVSREFLDSSERNVEPGQKRGARGALTFGGCAPACCGSGLSQLFDLCTQIGLVVEIRSRNTRCTCTGIEIDYGTGVVHSAYATIARRWVACDC